MTEEISKTQIKLTDIHSKNQKNRIKELEIKNRELNKKNFDFQSKLQNLIIKMNLINQENASLKLELKKLQISVNSPEKILSALNSTNKNSEKEDLIKENCDLKEANKKLILELSERESEIANLKSTHENTIKDLNKIITELKSKIVDKNNDKEDYQNMINNDLLNKYNVLEYEYEQLNLKYENEKDMNLEYGKDNEKLKEKMIKIENNLNDLVNESRIRINDMNELDKYLELLKTTRDQIAVMKEENKRLKNNYAKILSNDKQEFEKLTKKYNELYSEKNNLNDSNPDNNFSKLNKQISKLKDKIKILENENIEKDGKIQKNLEDFEKISESFKNLQNYMTETYEKNGSQITLIEERYLALENMVELEKNEIVNSNKELLSKIKQLTEKKNNFEDLENGNDKYNIYKTEIKNLTDENNILKSKIKEQGQNIFQLQKKISLFNVLKEENQTLKKNLKENNINFQVVIDELTNKTNKLNDELLQSKKKSSISLSKDDDNNNLQKEVEDLKAQLENASKEISELNNQLALLKVETANDKYIKDNELRKSKMLNNKYKEILEKKGLLDSNN